MSECSGNCSSCSENCSSREQQDLHIPQNEYSSRMSALIHYINQHGAEFIEGGLLCSCNGNSVQEILDQLEPEQGIRFRQ